MSREIIRLTKEATYGVRNPSPATDDVLLLDLQQDNAYTVRAVPTFAELPSSAASNMIVTTYSGQVNLAGRLMTYLRPSQAAWLMGMATNLTGTGTCKELRSFTVDHGIFSEDGTCTPILEAHVGCKFGAFTLSTDNSPQGSWLSGSFDLIAQKNVPITTTVFPIPALTDYAEDRPYVLQDTENMVTINDIIRDPSSVSIEVRNTLMPYRGNGKYIASLGWRGRMTTITMRGLYRTRGDRNDYEAITPRSVVVAFNDGANTLTFDFGPKNIYKTITDDVKLGDFNYQTVMLQNYLTTTDGKDFEVTLEENPEAAPPNVSVPGVSEPSEPAIAVPDVAPALAQPSAPVADVIAAE